MPRYTATGHGLYGPTSPGTLEQARTLGLSRASLFGRAEIVVVEQGQFWQHPPEDRRKPARLPDPHNRSLLRLVEEVHADGSIQTSLALRVWLHPANPQHERRWSRKTDYVRLDEDASRQVPLFTPPGAPDGKEGR